MKPPEELVSVLDREKGIVKTYLGDPWHRPENDILDTWLRGRSHRNRVAIAP